ncbi:SOS response-associated peptidase family protein [Microbacterium sp. A588]
MCASYGLDPRFTDAELLAEADADILDGLRVWAERNAGETVRPTGKNLRNLNPLVVPRDGDAAWEASWWGYLVRGEPAKFPSINTRSERLQERPGGLKGRGIVPMSSWFEMHKPDRIWQEFALDNDALFGVAAVTQPGRTADGEEFTCYSIVMRPAADHLSEVHDRMPVLIPTAFAHDWLHADGGREIIDEALLAAASLDERVTVTPRKSDKGAADRLF